MNISEIFGSNVFNETVMKERLPKKVFAEVMDVMAHGGQISMASADVVANAMKDWAVEKGATHYTHWFQPLTGITAEKHDSALSPPPTPARSCMEFTGKELIMGEPDASSFPSGGLRATFEARGYTAWDLTSSAFVKEMSCGTFSASPPSSCSYTGEALDNKTPLLRSMEAISEQAMRVLRLFGNTEAQQVTPSVGPEQEYFLVDREKYLTSAATSSTAAAPCSAPPPPRVRSWTTSTSASSVTRVGAFMKDLNSELWKLGITATTQHNEVAPAQHELAPIFSMANVAVDHNQLTMETMKQVATRHGLVCLLHEKPYRRRQRLRQAQQLVHRHRHWARTCWIPATIPSENLQFLLVLACIMKAVDDITPICCASSAADVGNDHRLGAQRGAARHHLHLPGRPAGRRGADTSYSGDATGAGTERQQPGHPASPPCLCSTKDATDRNRTSPFAFTGNKFEFRMVGSTDSIADRQHHAERHRGRGLLRGRRRAGEGRRL